MRRGHALLVGCLPLLGCGEHTGHGRPSGAADAQDAADAVPVGPENALSVLAEADYQSLVAGACTGATYQLGNGCSGPCSFGLPAPPTTCVLVKLHVVYSAGDGSRRLIQQNQVDTCHYGWRLAADEATIEVCDLSCQSLECDSSPQIEVLAGCSCQGGPY